MALRSLLTLVRADFSSLISAGLWASSSGSSSSSSKASAALISASRRACSLARPVRSASCGSARSWMAAWSARSEGVLVVLAGFGGG